FLTRLSLSKPIANHYGKLVSENVICDIFYRKIYTAILESIN
ncbi:MAG: hypothetical protein ACI9W0_000801, partial [Gammaproteobacteria bacterium]